MAKALGDSDANVAKGVARSIWFQWAFVSIGATGAPTIATDQSSPEFTITRSAAGTYALTFRPCPFGLHPIVVIKSAAKTVEKYVITAYDATAGTATFKTLTGAAVDTDPANGDALSIYVPGMPNSRG